MSEALLFITDIILIHYAARYARRPPAMPLMIATLRRRLRQLRHFRHYADAFATVPPRGGHVAKLLLPR